MKQIYAALGLLCFCGFAYRLFNLESIHDLGMLVAWGIGIIINLVSFKYEKEHD